MSLVSSKHIFNRNDKSEHITNLDNVVRIIIVWSEWRDSNSRHPAPKCVSEPSASTLPPSLALSVAPTVPLWSSVALLASDAAFAFRDLCGMKFCILKVLPTGYTPASDAFIAENNSEIAPHKQGNKSQHGSSYKAVKPDPCHVISN